MDMTMHQIIEELRKSPLVKEKQVDENISSFNFTRKAFQKKEWNDMTVRARGLFIDTKNERVKARSYDKFFAIGERSETELNYIMDHFTYPIDVYIKENGYLGICSWNIDRTLFTASKSSIDGPYAERFRKILLNTLGNKSQDFCEYLRQENLSAVFEVIDPENDVHIIEYDTPQVILLDLIYNNFMEEDGVWDSFWCKTYTIVKMAAMRFGFKCKRKVCQLWSAAELDVWYNEVIAPEYKYKGEYIEGFVLQDLYCRMVKVKTDYYNYWKCLRNAIPAARKGTVFNYKYIDTRIHPYMWNVLALIAKVAPQYYKEHGEDIDIITIRKMYGEDY